MSDANELLTFPVTKSLNGERLSLRSFRQSDITSEYIAWLNDPLVVRFSNQRFRRHDARTCTAYLASFESTDNLFLAIEARDLGRSVGTMTAYRNRHHGTADLGIMVGDRRVWGRGYGLEAWTLLLDWLLSVCLIRKVTCGTLACNLPMRAIAERSGMHLEAARQAQEIVEGENQDVLYFAKFRSDC